MCYLGEVQYANKWQPFWHVSICGAPHQPAHPCASCCWWCPKRHLPVVPAIVGLKDSPLMGMSGIALSIDWKTPKCGHPFAPFALDCCCNPLILLGATELKKKSIYQSPEWTTDWYVPTKQLYLWIDTFITETYRYVSDRISFSFFGLERLNNNPHFATKHKTHTSKSRNTHTLSIHERLVSGVGFASQGDITHNRSCTIDDAGKDRPRRSHYPEW